MGWWWPFGKSSAEAKPLPKARQQQLDADDARRQAVAGGKDAAFPPAPARPASIFEFGKPAPVTAEHLVGMCAGDNPDAIQACTWTIEPLQGKAREKRPLYRIEF
ncbi:hypothetical protein Rsub_05376 [Raphidocelis subcapitata]|uniref:Uncharacterized protein n=1 Tax=Raphidocelis subcapitata TaxID=307507 RepID=A0A2V0P363_9CHLO|nr:hypothetical protein Rsub_05376 [Raphidocelis subcapitata]|eukprot:GBF92293.1 hypothetical protein Rsub_05376 [Raphidocelis subcapitata]